MPTYRTSVPPGGFAVGQVATPRLTPIPDTEPGDVDISVPCKAHIILGTSVAHFKFADADGHLYSPPPTMRESCCPSPCSTTAAPTESEARRRRAVPVADW
ncbi:hypothetical protein ABZV93_15665 [Actinopolymorpha sp. NPDC004070]|uniref:hypothetical protein n=1 Tax=Actinopolymorpha sp. NPDC004070 TaxID=3154548 RepID=UPI0033A8C286